MLAKRRLDKISDQNRWLRELCGFEEQALAMVRPVDLATMEPEIIECRKGDANVMFNYWRAVLSSEPQGKSYSWYGRSASFLVRDRVSGGFLGVFAISDPPNTLKPMLRHFKWDENEEARLARQHQALMLRRCLPIYEFGQMTGGKLLALAATSQEVLRLFELRYSFQFVYFLIRTLHGKSSQYNRLQQRGIELIEVDAENKGFYGMELRKKALAYMREGTPYGKTAMHKLGDQVDYWKDRWLNARVQSTGNPSLITPDPERYRLSNQLDSKRMTPAAIEAAELEKKNGDDGAVE
jgi:hypothetical protein